jgi:hypothetical protein
MPLSPDQASEALRDIAAVERRSARAYGYQRASPYLILWGVLWAVGYGLTAVAPQRANPVWITTLAIGLAATFLIGLRDPRRADPPDATRVAAGRRWVFPAIALITFVFVAATIAVMAPVSPRQVGAFIPLVIGFGYALRGVWGGLRFIVASVVIAAAVLAGFFLLRAYFELWMAAIGGGALVLAGVWLRRA